MQVEDIPGIAISGKITSGKSELAKYLAVTLEFEVVSTAGPLKEMVHTALINNGFIPSEVLIGKMSFNEWFAANKAIMRPLYVAWGQTFRNGLHENYWINNLIHTHHDKRFIIDDMRFRNEFNALKEAGFITIRLEFSDYNYQRERIERLYPGTSEESLKDISETDLDIFVNYNFADSHHESEFDLVFCCDDNFYYSSGNIDRYYDLIYRNVIELIHSRS